MSPVGKLPKLHLLSVGCPAADDLVLIASELAGNAVLHSQSRGEFFTVRCQAHPGHVRVEVEDLGGPWRTRRPDDRPEHFPICRGFR